MPGVKIHHPSLRNCVYTVIDEDISYDPPFQCPMCGVLHYNKTHHLQLDANGDVVVDERIYDIWKASGLVAELVDAKAIKHPMPIVLDLDQPLPDHTVISREEGEIK